MIHPEDFAGATAIVLMLLFLVFLCQIVATIFS